MRIYKDEKTQRQTLKFHVVSKKLKPKVWMPVVDVILCLLCLIALIYFIGQGYMYNCIMYIFSQFVTGFSVKINFGVDLYICVFIWVLAILYHNILNRIVNWVESSYIGVYADKIIFYEYQLIQDISAKQFYTYTFKKIDKVKQRGNKLYIDGLVVTKGSFSKEKVIRKLCLTTEFEEFELLLEVLSTFNNKNEYSDTWNKLIEKFSGEE